VKNRLILTGIIAVILLWTPSLFALSPQIRFDMLKAKLVEQLKTQKYSSALETITELRSLGLPVPSSLDYFEGKALFESGKEYEAYVKLEKYVEENSQAKYYNKAIAYLVKAEDAYKKEMQKREQQRIAREKAAEEARIAAEQRAQKIALLRQEAEVFSTLPQIDKKISYTGLMWTLPVPKKYRRNPYLPVKITGAKQEAISYCENLTAGGYNDWRVPTLKEFSTISGKGSNYSHIAWGEDPYYSIWVWGSPEFSNDNHHFVKEQLYPIRNGEAYSTNKSTANIMCVRTDSQEKFDNYFKHKYQVIEWKGNKIMVEDRYMVSSDRCYFVDPDMTFSGAINYCKNLTLGGYDDWRVPTEQDMLKRLPCHIARELYFLRDDPGYNDLWYGHKSLFSQKAGYQKQSECKIRTARTSARHKVRCVRDIGEKKNGTQRNSSPLNLDGR
jgi:hypothetical protein